MRAGLKRTGGDRRRYEILLRKLAEQQRDAAKAMRAFLADNDTATAERTAHSLRGAAGTLGAAALMEVAANAETAVKTGRGVDAAIALLARSLDPVIAAIEQAIPDESGDGFGAPARDPAGVVAALIRLKQLLENDDGDAADYMVNMQPTYKDVLTPVEIKTLSDRIGSFDFDAALSCLSGIASRLSLNLEANVVEQEPRGSKDELHARGDNWENSH